MCLIALAWQYHEQAPLLLAANRDEFHARPTAPASFWDEDPSIFAGRDLEAGGTWLGVNKNGRFAAITNVREQAAKPLDSVRSRGELTSRYLQSSEPPESYLARIAQHRHEYRGFNLLIGDTESLWYLHGSHESMAEPTQLSPGVYGLSNAALDTSWPKLERAKHTMQETIAATPHDTPNHDQLIACLSNRAPVDAAQLPDTGIDLEMERMLSPQFIVSSAYGTRCASSMRFHIGGAIDFRELRFDASGRESGRDNFRFEPAL